MACLVWQAIFHAVEQMLSVSKLTNIGQTIFYELYHDSAFLPPKWKPSFLIQIIFWVDFFQALC